MLRIRTVILPAQKLMSVLTDLRTAPLGASQLRTEVLLTPPEGSVLASLLVT